MDAEPVGAHVIHHTEEETLQYLGAFFRFVEVNGHLCFKAEVLFASGLKEKGIPSPFWLWELPLWPSSLPTSRPFCLLRAPARKTSKNAVVNLIPMEIILQNKHIFYRQGVVRCDGVIVRHCEISFFQANLKELWIECNEFCGNKWIKLRECHLIFKCMFVCFFF